MELIIEKLVYGGDGLARLPADERGRGKAAFVPFVLEGEKVDAVLLEQKPGFARARAERILAASPQRIEARCPYFGRCGGCNYQHTGYEHQLEIKAAILRENLRRIAKLELDKELEIHPSPPWNYRNRARLRVHTAPEFAIGYYKFNSHELLTVEQCPISSPLINRAIDAMWQMGRGGKVSDRVREIEFFANADDSQLLAEVHCSAEIADAAEQFSADFRALLPEACGIVFVQIRAGKLEAAGDPQRLAASGADHLTYKAGRASYRVSAGAFFQVNRHLTDELVSLVERRHGGGQMTNRQPARTLQELRLISTPGWVFFRLS